MNQEIIKQPHENSSPDIYLLQNRLKQLIEKSDFDENTKKDFEDKLNKFDDLKDKNQNNPELLKTVLDIIEVIFLLAKIKTASNSIQKISENKLLDLEKKFNDILEGKIDLSNIEEKINENLKSLPFIGTNLDSIKNSLENF